MTPIRWRALAGAASAAAWCALATGAHAQELTEEQLREKALYERIEALEAAARAPDTLRAFWKDGLNFATNDGEFTLKIGGRLQFESQWNSAERDLERTSRLDGAASDPATTKPIGPLEDAVEARRARLYLSGTLHEHVEFKWQYDFAKGTVGHKDVYGGLVHLGDWIPNVRFGHQFEPFGLDAVTSSNDSTFVERAPVSNVFAPQRNPGIVLWKGDDSFSWAAGAFREDSSDTHIAVRDGGYNLTARITARPIFESKGKRMVHVGIAATRRDVPGRGAETVAYAGKPEVNTFGNFVNTGTFGEADADWRYAGEAAVIWGPWSVQGEYMKTRTEMNSSSPMSDPSFSGWYAQAGCVLTGENRGFKPEAAVFTNPRPSSNAFDDGGIGAVEVAARYSTLDLNDGRIATGGIEGGALDVWTVGLNWYLNPNLRLMTDYSRIDLRDVLAALGRGGVAHVVQMRLQVAF